MTTLTLFWLVLVASFGGGVVVIGLLMERFSEKEEYKNLDSYRRWKSINVWGEWTVMAGIVIEIVVGIQTGIEIWNADPMNAPINSISAVVKLKVKGVIQVPFLTPGQGVFAMPSKEESPPLDIGGITFFEGTNVSSPIYNLSSGSGDIRTLGSGLVGGGKDWRGVVIGFKENDFGSWDMTSSFSSNRFKAGAPVGKFNEVGSFVISLPAMETNVTVESGIVEVKVNSSRWSFPIPAQRQRWGLMTSQMTTNAAKQIEWKVLPIPVTDMTEQKLGVFDGK